MTEQSSIKNGHNNQMSFITSEAFDAYLQQLLTTPIPCDTQEVCPVHTMRATSPLS